MSRRFSLFNATSLALGFAFLYLPIVALGYVPLWLTARTNTRDSCRFGWGMTPNDRERPMHRPDTPSQPSLVLLFLPLLLVLAVPVFLLDLCF